MQSKKVYLYNFLLTAQLHDFLKILQKNLTKNTQKNLQFKIKAVTLHS